MNIVLTLDFASTPASAEARANRSRFEHALETLGFVKIRNVDKAWTTSRAASNLELAEQQVREAAHAAQVKIAKAKLFEYVRTTEFSNESDTPSLAEKIGGFFKPRKLG